MIPKTESVKGHSPSHAGHLSMKVGAHAKPLGKTGPAALESKTFAHGKAKLVKHVGANAPHNPLKPKLSWNTRGATVKKAKAKRYPIPNQKRELQKNV